MLQVLTVMIIHSSPFDELAQGPSSPKGQEDSFSLQGGKTVQFTEIHFSGNQSVSTQQLEKLVSPYKNKSLSEVDLEQIKERVIRFYKSRGYQKVSVTFPKKQKKGVLEISIVERKDQS